MTPAERLLQDLGVDAPSEIDVEAIAWCCGVRVNYRPLAGCEAQIVGYGDKAIVIVNEHSHPKRKRFSIAHELGHWYHHRGQSSVCRAADIEDYYGRALAHERVADKYAADLLLPPYLFIPRTRELKNVSIDVACKIADEFDTSLTATAMRLVDLGPLLSVLVCHRPEGRKWFRRREGLPDSWVPQQELDARSGALDVLFGKESRSPRKVVNAALWFGGRDARKADVLEETIRVSPSEVLTLLVFKEKLPSCS